MVVQLSLDRCGVVLVGRNQGGTAPGPQPQRGPTNATDCGSDPLLMAGEGQSRLPVTKHFASYTGMQRGCDKRNLNFNSSSKHKKLGLLHPGDPSQQHAQILHPGI